MFAYTPWQCRAKLREMINTLSSSIGMCSFVGPYMEICAIICGHDQTQDPPTYVPRNGKSGPRCQLLMLCVHTFELKFKPVAWQS
jgi:hypothetical protein